MPRTTDAETETETRNGRANGTTRDVGERSSRENGSTSSRDSSYDGSGESERSSRRSSTSRGDQRYEHRTAKIVELVCSSSRSFEAAIENGLEDARQSTRGITGADIVHMSIQCEDGRPVAYKVNLKLSFGVER